SAGFLWHSVEDNGNLRALDTSAEQFEGTFIAVPRERKGEVVSFLDAANKGALTLRESHEMRHSTVSSPEICANMNSRGEFIRPGGSANLAAVESAAGNHSCTFFATAKPFEGHSGIIQRNALKSWMLLHPNVEVILFGDDKGAAEIAAELGLRHVPFVE